jgi:hypothetical protein
METSKRHRDSKKSDYTAHAFLGSFIAKGSIGADRKEKKISKEDDCP